ncbi:MAG: hypothetical protein JW801_09400 [Bacteroidales bacterium]|nr:hypothetical protein [Bacteroidales bacterium]
MKSILISFLLILIIQDAFPQDLSNPPTFKGGMMLHSGYLSAGRSEQAISGSCFGIGGKLSFTAGKYLRLGTEGYASTLGYSGQEGYYKLGWGGLLVDFPILSGKRLSPVVSLTLGGGHVKDVYFLESVPGAPATHEVVYRSFATMLAVPSVSLEYSLKTKLTLVLKVDYAIPLFSDYTDDFAWGPRVYLGVLFNRY